MMESFFALVGIVAVLFVWTNVDDLFVLLGFFSAPGVRARHVVFGQYLGIAVLYGVSVLVSLLSIALPQAYIGLLGLAPILIGCTKLYALWRDAGTGVNVRDKRAVASVRENRRILAVAMATVANGADNVSVYTPLFATHSAVEVAVAGLVFALMTALWCLLGHWLVHHPALGAPIRRYGYSTLPFLLIGFGISILYASGTFALI